MSNEPKELPARDQAAAEEGQWLVLLPLVAVALSLAFAELGLLRAPWEPPSRADIAPVTAWVVQSFITGCLAILTLTAWGNSFARVKWPGNGDSRMTLGVTSAWSCFGWIMWIALRASGDGQDDPVFPLLLFALVTLIFTVPLLWHAVVMMAKPARSIWVVVAFLALAAGLQCGSTMRIATDPVYLFIINSALIAAAFAVWLVVVSLPAPRTSTPRTA